MAACLCLVIGISVFIINRYIAPPQHAIAATFELNGISYRIIHYPEDFERYGLINEDGKPLFYEYGNENGNKIGKDDLGEVMGTVTLPGDSGMVENTVYHFALFPDDDTICIIEFSNTNTYHLYVAED